MAFSMFTQKHLALLTAISVLTISAPIPKGRLFLPGEAIKSLQPTPCNHPGNSDFYGLGIRLGIYLQILSTMLCMIDLESSDPLYDAHDSNAILLLATFIAVLKSTPSRSIELVDVVIMLRMIWLIIVCGFSLAHLTEEFKRAKKAQKLAALITTPSALFFRILVVGLVSSYNVWFWFRGVAYFQHGNPCPTYAFFFAKLAANGRLQGFYKFTSIVIMLMPPAWLLAYAVLLVASVAFGFGIGFGFLVVVYAVCLPIWMLWILVTIFGSVYRTVRGPHPVQKVRQFIRKLHRSVFSWRALKRILKIIALAPMAPYMPYMDKLAGKWNKIRQRGTKSEPGVRAGTLPIRRGKNRISTEWAMYLVFLAVYYVFSVIGIELTIYWNAVEGSYDIGSTGQLIPFVIGILTTVKVLAHVLSNTDGEAYKYFQRVRFFMVSVFSSQHRVKRRWSFDELQKPLGMHGRGRLDDRLRRTSRRKPKRVASLPLLKRYDPSKDTPTSPETRTRINKWLRGISQGPSKDALVERLVRQFQHGLRDTPQGSSRDARIERLVRPFEDAST
jgi:hypothetical protein